jgi:spoIIIJ-associated protein
MGVPENQKEIYNAAQEILETLISLLGLSGKVLPSDEFTTSDDNGEYTSIGFNIEGEDLGILIGRRGQTMASLQYVVRLIMAHKMQVQLPIVLDVEGYKQRRCEGLRMLAARLAEQVKNRKVPFTMEPMSAFERRVIHLTLADHPDVVTESIGFGDARKVVITPKTLPQN